jgi:hypothetical protein
MDVAVMQIPVHVACLHDGFAAGALAALFRLDIQDIQDIQGEWIPACRPWPEPEETISG